MPDIEKQLPQLDVTISNDKLKAFLSILKPAQNNPHLNPNLNPNLNLIDITEKYIQD